MRIDQMAAFVRMADCHSLKEASKALYVTPQALSASIAKMEGELGVKLMERSQLGYELTPEGVIFRETAVRVLREYERGLRKIGGMDGGSSDRKGTLEIYGNLVFQKVLLPRIMEIFRDRYPSYHIRTVTSDRKATCKVIREQGEDIKREMVGFVGTMSCDGVGFDMESMEGLERYLVLEGRLVACVSGDSLLARHKKLSLKTISSYPLTCLSMNGQWDYERLFEGYGKIQQVLITDSIHTWLSATEDYNGISLIQENMLEQRHWGRERLDNSRIVQIEIAEKVRCQIYLVTGKKMSPVVRELLQELQKTGGPLRGQKKVDEGE